MLHAAVNTSGYDRWTASFGQTRLVPFTIPDPKAYVL